jgi:serine/threonine protein kinase
MLKKNHRERLLAEKSLLAASNDSHANSSAWVVDLYRTFQDQKNLYMVMEYLPGGNLMTHLIRLGRFTEDQTRFFMAELVEAVHSIHKLGFIHRDIKPDNIVLTSDGHVKLIDFGLCKFEPNLLDDTSRYISSPAPLMSPACLTLKPTLVELKSTSGNIKSFVGTPQYMAPEVVNRNYDHTSDFWSIGMIAYECLMGGTPFYDETIGDNGCGGANGMKRILYKVINYEKFLPIPYPGIPVSREAVSFLRGLLCPSQLRMRYDQIRGHEFFRGIDWTKLRDMQAPFTTIAPGPSENAEKIPPTIPYEPIGILKDRNLEFVGYTYNKFAA